MFVALILLILFAQFLIGYFALKSLTGFNETIVSLNTSVTGVNRTLRSDFVGIRTTLQEFNNKIEFIMEQEDKFRIVKILFWVKAMITTLLILKKRKKIFKVFSVVSALGTLFDGILELA